MKHFTISKAGLLVFWAFTLSVNCLDAFGQEETAKKASEDEAAELAKKLANPIASLISVPFQNNSDYGIGALKGSRNTMNIQPVVPISLSKNLNLIARWVQPIVSQYNITGLGAHESGLADAVVSGFIGPKNAKNGLTWGAGPVFLVPVATNDKLASKQLGIGPTIIGLKQTGGWTIGGLVNQIWGVGNQNDRPDVNQMFIQPFVGYNWKSGAGLTGVVEWTENWQAGTSTVWFIPMVSGLTSIGKQKTQLAFGPRMNLAAPDATKAKWGWRGALVFLFPK